MNNSSQFDPSVFLDATITEPSVRRSPLPAGQDFVGVIGEVKARTWQGRKDPTQSGVVMDVQIELDVSSQPNLGYTTVTLTDGIMLELNDAGAIDNAPGKNGKLRRYREALGMNEAGKPFSFRAMQGRTIRVKISHRMHEGEAYDQVESVAKA